MSVWIEKELGDILTLNYGWSLPEKKRVAGDVPVYGSNGVVGSHNKALVNSAGLIIGRKGSAGNVHYSRKPFCPIDTTFFIAPADLRSHSRRHPMPVRPSALCGIGHIQTLFYL